MATAGAKLALREVDRRAVFQDLQDQLLAHQVDLRQHAVDMVTSVLDALGLEKVTLLGGSMGGFFSLVMALDKPERVHKLVRFTVGVTNSASIPLRILCGVPGAQKTWATVLRKVAGLSGFRPEVYLGTEFLDESNASL